MDITNYFKNRKTCVFSQKNINRSIYEEANINSRHSIHFKGRVTCRLLQTQQHFKVLIKYGRQSTETRRVIIKHYEKTNLEAGIINKNDPISSMFLGRPLNEVYSVVDQSGELVRCYIDLI